ncbi:phosphotransferase [Microbacterium dauci]|uniref:Phosphotransferase n=1 Tax=Microbacterium dauci TaxID=3048008 RepID=A0ABT6ZFS2_9MICO|nr:phosphotransferase [Microbacterium sp. LX3-4]MDJ1115014.1 phosphotransferase [Microbacterium sp. LX3-4]
MPQPSPEVDLSVAEVDALVRAQHPELTASVVRVGAGWDNAVYRLGERLAVRVPRRAVAVPLLRNEQRWLPEIAERMPVAVPAPVAVGEPGPEFPWPWSIMPWFDGAVAASASQAARDGIAEELAAALRALHVPAPADAPFNPVRGVPLADRDAAIDDRFAGRPALERAWREGVAAPMWPHEPVWVHGDVHPGNIVLQGGGIQALIDFGDMCAGDPACDLAIAWLGFSAAGRAAFRDALGDYGDPHLWTRASAWAAAIAALLADADDAWLRDMSAHAVRELG